MKHDPTDPQMNRDPLHEDLCAYLLGEAEPEVSARIEVALAADPELAAERDRLAQVLGLVQGSLTGEERLSDAALASLLEAAGDTQRIAATRE